MQNQNSSFSPSDETTRMTYETAAARMAEKFRSQGPRIADIERFFGLINKVDPTIVEIGCGDGRDAREICKRTVNYWGFDYSISMIELAREYVPRARFSVADAREFDFPENVDGIVAFASLLHLPPEKIRPILVRAFRALAQGGILCLSFKFGTGNLDRTDEYGVRTYWYYEPEDIIHMLPEATLVHGETSEVCGQKFFEVFLKKI